MGNLSATSSNLDVLFDMINDKDHAVVFTLGNNEYTVYFKSYAPPGPPQEKPSPDAPDAPDAPGVPPLRAVPRA